MEILLRRRVYLQPLLAVCPRPLVFRIPPPPIVATHNKELKMYQMCIMFNQNLHEEWTFTSHRDSGWPAGSYNIYQDDATRGWRTAGDTDNNSYQQQQKWEQTHSRNRHYEFNVVPLIVTQIVNYLEGLVPWHFMAHRVVEGCLGLAWLVL